MSGIFSLPYHVVVLFGSYVHEVVVYRILRRVAVTYFIVQMRAGGFSGIAGFRYQVTAFYFVTFFYFKLAQMGVTRHVAVAVVNLQQVYSLRKCRFPA